jgi:hypothetical protein
MKRSVLVAAAAAAILVTSCVIGSTCAEAAPVPMPPQQQAVNPEGRGALPVGTPLDLSHSSVCFCPPVASQPEPFVPAYLMAGAVVDQAFGSAFMVGTPGTVRARTGLRLGVGGVFVRLH